MFNYHVFSGHRQIIMAMLLFASASIFAQDDLTWNSLDPENTVYLQLQDDTVVIELNPVFAPKTVEHFIISGSIWA